MQKVKLSPILKKTVKKLGNGLGLAGLAIICCPVFILLAGGCIQFCGCGNALQDKRRNERYAQNMAKRSKNEPVPLVSKTRGRRRVSISESHTSVSRSRSNLYFIGRFLSRRGERGVEERDNNVCFLMRLPVEVRRKIWIEVLGDDLLHILQLPKRLGHKRCIFPSSSSSSSQHQHTSSSSFSSSKETTLPPFYDSTRLLCFGTSIVTSTNNDHMISLCLPNSKKYRYGDPLDERQKSDDSLSLLLTTRKIYTETMSILYGTNTFDVNHPSSLLYLSKTIPSSHLSKIQYLQIRYAAPFIFKMDSRARGWNALGVEGRKGRMTGSVDSVEIWEGMCEVIAKEMKGLRVLRLELTGFPDGEYLVVGAREREDVVGRCLEGIVGKKKGLGVGDREDRLEDGLEGGVRGLDDFGLRLFGFEGEDEGEEIDIKGMERRLGRIVCSGK